LQDVDGVGLEELLEDDAVLDVLAGGDADFRDFAADAGVAEDVVGAGGLFHPPGFEFGELTGALDGFEDAPLLVGVDHELVGPADLFADDVAAAEVVDWVAADFELEVGPAFGEGFVAEAADLVFGVAEPAYGGGVGGIAGLLELGKAGGFAGVARGGEDVEGFLRVEGVVDVAEVYGGEELLWLHVGEELPDRLIFGLGIEVPDGVDEGSGGEVDDAFFGAEPAELRVVGELAAEGAEVVGDRAEGAIDNVAREVLERLDDEICAAAEGEGESVAFEAVVGFEDAVGGGVVGVLVNGVGADLLARGWEAEIDDADFGDEDFVQGASLSQCVAQGLRQVEELGGDWLGRRPAAVDGDDGAVDELGLVGAEVTDERGDVLGCAEAADGLAGDKFGADLLFFVGVVLVEVALDEGGLDGAGSDAVDAKLFWIIDGYLAGHGVDCAFAGAVGEALFDADRASDGTDIHDAAARGEEQREGCLRDEKYGVDVDAHDASEVVLRGAGDVAYEADTGVVDEDIKLRNGGKGSGDGRCGGDIHLNGFCAGELGGKGVGGGEVEIGYENLGTGAGEFAAGCGADAAGASGYEGDLVVETEGVGCGRKIRWQHQKMITLFCR
jgi:hypothetical protein